MKGIRQMRGSVKWVIAAVSLVIGAVGLAGLDVHPWAAVLALVSLVCLWRSDVLDDRERRDRGEWPYVDDEEY